MRKTAKEQVYESILKIEEGGFFTTKRLHEVSVFPKHTVFYSLKLLQNEGMVDTVPPRTKYARRWKILSHNAV